MAQTNPTAAMPTAPRDREEAAAADVRTEKQAAGPAPLPKGQSGPTMARIRELLQAAPDDISATEIADQIGISRSTAQRYLAELARQGRVELHLHYGATGRPEHRYRTGATADWPANVVLGGLSDFSKGALTRPVHGVVNPGTNPDDRKDQKPMFHPIKKVLVGFAALAALALGGSAIAGAATSSTATTMTPSTSSTSTTQAPPAFNGPAHGTAAHENAEKTVTGAAAAKAQAAAVKSVGSGTAGAVTADFTGNGFETTVTKSDGSQVEVHLSGSYSVEQGPGGPGGPAGGHGG